MADTGHSTVALARAESRYRGVAVALEHIAGEIQLASASKILIKPNFVSVDRQLAATHVDAVRAVLDFVRERFAGPVVIADGPAMAAAREAFANFGYESLRGEYGVDLVDLNADQTVPVQVFDRQLRPLKLHLARSVIEADYRISVGPPKVHDTVVVTLAVKNMVMGSLTNPSAARPSSAVSRLLGQATRWVPTRLHYSALAERAKGTLLGRQRGMSKLAMHQGYPVINLNLALIAPLVWPHLAVIDGWQGMEGEGPSAGDPVDWRVALAGTDALAVDLLTASLMGFDPASIGYLQYCSQMGLGVGRLERIETVGNVPPQDARRLFRPHPTYSRQVTWRESDDRLATLVAARLRQT